MEIDVSHFVALGLLGATAVGITMLTGHLLVLWRHVRGPIAAPARRPPISILKPLCGLDDRLRQNLDTFAALPYPDYEVLLGVSSIDDAAYPTAVAVAREWPRRFRVVVQRGEPGLNPKVNQLMTLARAARNDLLVISDSNTRVPPGYLDEIAALMADDGVGLVTHPIVGQGDDQFGARLGSALDNMHLSGSITPALAAAKVVFGKDYVVGKSMAMRWRDVRALGGFGVVKDVLAEDFVLGRMIPERLGKRVVLARSVVRCVSLRRSVGSFVKRYARWNVMQHQCAGLPCYWGLLLLNPTLLATAALALAPGRLTAAAWIVCAATRIALDAAAGRVLRGRAFATWALPLAPFKDLMAAGAWVYGLTNRTIEWRSHRLVVLRGSVLHAAPQVIARRRSGSDTGHASATA
ncbi:MAG TPA: glycosyltransferase [Polyangia bacterium]|jgi:ceramide glucosyltransferase|nr:glycosyltransferase [Polyangia bacterium]